jgi:hypothetical protein
LRWVCLSFSIFAQLTLAACTNTAPLDPQEIGYWGIGWALKGAPNRLSTAHPAIVALTRREAPLVKAMGPSSQLRRSHREQLNNVQGIARKRLERHFLGTFVVAGLGCSGKTYRVFDRGEPVALFLVLDQTVIQNAKWHSCGAAGDEKVGQDGFAEFLRIQLRQVFGLPGKSG